MLGPLTSTLDFGANPSSLLPRPVAQLQNMPRSSGGEHQHVREVTRRVSAAASPLLPASHLRCLHARVQSLLRTVPQSNVRFPDLVQLRVWKGLPQPCACSVVPLEEAQARVEPGGVCGSHKHTGHVTFTGCGKQG
eukprot:346539-Chlamydomonas_euryale.AAC.8